MGRRTAIQWCDDTVNPTTGCDGCELWHRIERGPCYAGPLHEGRLAKSMPNLYAANFTQVRTAPGRMVKAVAGGDLRGTSRPGKPWLDGQPRIIFVGDMGDVFSRGVSSEYIRDEIVAAAASKNGSRHMLLLLTKQPKRAAEFGTWLADQGIAWPRNLGCGTSVTSDRTLGRLDHLMRVPAAFRFASLEPLRSAVSVWQWFGPRTDGQWMNVVECGHHAATYGLNWVILGGESRQGGHEPTPFDLAWIDALDVECHDHQVPFFVKQYGSAAYRIRRMVYGDKAPIFHATRDEHGGDWDEWEPCHRVREVPAFGRYCGPAA